MGKAKELAELGDKLTVSGSAVTVSGFNYDNIVDSAPGALDTLNELAAAIGDDANFSATVTNSIATKLPLAGGTLTGTLTINTSGSGVPAINFNHTNANADNFQITAGTPGTANSGFTIRDIDESANRLVINTDGNVGVGTDTPDQKMHLFTDSGTTLYKAEVNANSTVGLEIKKTGSTTQSWRIVDGETVNGALQFYDVTDSRVAMQIDGAGRLLVGKTATGLGNAGHEFGTDGYFYHTRAGDLMWLNRTGSTGTYITFMKDGGTVGRLGLESSGLHLDGESSHAGLKLFASAIGPRQNYADIDATIDLGWTGGRFKDIYASGTVYATPGGNDGSSANYAANSANEILNNYGYKPSGLYWIREPNTGTPKQIYCDMETDGGGWMLWLEYNTSTNSMHNQATARGNLARSYNNNYSKYEVMVDASYVGQINRRSIRGVWELDVNGGIRTNGFRNWGEVRLPETVGDQFQPDLDTYFNSGSNSEWIGRTEYYSIAGASGWTSIGSGSQYVYIREPNPAVKPGTMRSYGGINYVWDYDGVQYGWWIHESSYAVPMFNTVTQNAGFEVGYAGGRRDVMEPNNSTGQNSYVNVSNGNNGPAILGVGSGVLVGEFSIMFNLGYSWGWSEMYMQDAIRSDNNMKNGGSPGAVLGDVFYYANNSSNNQGYYVYKTSDGVTRATASNLTPYSFGNYYTMTRRRDGNLYVRDPGANIYNPGKFFGPMKFFTGAQSPHSTQILNVISAGRNSALTASNEQAQTTLRH
tara:strand:- start:5633 stop:7903 length:2271 start_codon:yes stop_codon:yes gene_type:complete